MPDFDYVLDTSAVLAVILREPERQPVVELLQEARSGATAVALPFLALMESEYTLLRRFEPDEVAAALLLVAQWPTSIVESNEEWRHEAARLKAGGGISLADAWMAALATLSNAQLVHKDEEFDKVSDLKSLRL
jgi:predicted nucleic acid-binding protein